ncbi:SDR family oxidoreductase [Streptosporangium sp. NBC_01810]|uniref:SDR family oxidoreductase n=1 Tax=Streptosporangium sp. NBC_01810 TaxID=2975951 RepID=UPI002DD81B19|nr:SDR family oxidoreductase [Streptosporangium sp. NBC_01810]WSA24619.1 SDR family oxidoreductase [Streptosporangium sp. NBC_01810]
MSGPHDGRIAVVTGAGRGIGQEYAAALASDGATVVIADVDDRLAAETVQLITDKGGKAVARHVDVAAKESTAELGDWVRREFGAAHILVNNAAIYHSMRMDAQMDVDIDYWRKVFSVNLDGALLMTQALAPLMIEAGWGRIVNQTSTGAYAGLGGAYSVSKLALIGLSQGFARELGKHGITVNTIAPGLIHTEATMVTVSAEARAAMLAQQAVKKEGQPADLVAALRFFCSDEAGWVSGQVTIVDGFKTLRL